ncbi:MAG: hypothetical protein HY587_06855 [Candidatus Omnitrophica bacterium]|nr:hypothetical protein [Candidatus Omnitrophota bacterium]
MVDLWQFPPFDRIQWTLQRTSVEWILTTGLAGTVTGIYFFTKGLRSLRYLRMIENIPTSKIHAAALGLVELKGRAIPLGDHAIKSPFSREPCVYFQFVVKEKQGPHKWKTVAREQSRDRFYLEDETGRILVSPVGADMHLDKITYSDDTSMPLGSEWNLDRLGLTDFSGARRDMKIEEWLIRPEQDIFVIGTTSLLRYAKPSANPLENLIIRKGDFNPIFLISDKSEKDLSALLRFWIKAGTYGGPFVTLASLGLLLHFFLVRFPDIQEFIREFVRMTTPYKP